MIGTGIIDQNIQASELFDRLSYHGFSLIRIRNVAGCADNEVPILLEVGQHLIGRWVIR